MLDNVWPISIENLWNSSLKDTADSLNATLTTLLILFYYGIITCKTYLLSPFSCFITNPPSGIKFDVFMNDYCWVSETYIISINETVSDKQNWDDRIIKRIAYYQWIPSLLALQCLFFYLPNIVWNIACHHSHGTDLTVILTKSKELACGSMDNNLHDQILAILEDFFFVHRDYRKGLLSDVRRKVSKNFKFLIASKRLATMLSMHYLFVKLLYLFNLIAQFYMIRRIFNIQNVDMDIYNKVTSVLFRGEEWTSSPYFPRTSFCAIKNIRSVGVTGNTYVAQCVLPINMLNEKFFFFLLIWLPALGVITFFSFIVWIFRLFHQRKQIRDVIECLKMRQNYKKMEKMTIERFVLQFLRSDGMFIIYMIRGYSGDVVTSTIVNSLYKLYCHKYRKIDFNDDKAPDQIESLSLKLEPGRKVKMNSEKPSAPESKEFML